MTIEQAYELAIRHHTSGQPREAEKLYRQILAINPTHGGTLSMLGVLLGQGGRLAEGLQLARQATQFDPANPSVWGNLALMLAQSGKLDEAIENYRKVLALRPDSFEAHNNLGNTLRAAGRSAEAVEAYRAALLVLPNSGEIRWNLGVTLLQLGDFVQGWREYEGRLRARNFPLHASFQQPPWDGSELGGRRILLHTEQGLGDAMQFIRYVPLVKARGGRVIVRCPPALVRLLKTVDGLEEIVGDHVPIPQFDAHCPLMSLPLRFGTTLETIPAQVPYLHAQADLADAWSKRVAALPGKVKVGLAWAGNPRYVQDRARSIGLARLAPLGQVPDVTFVSLQKGEPAAQANSPPPGMQLVDWTAELQDFADTAALICQLDLIICVDTAVAHVAGALGRPTWLLLSEPAEWRWLLNRSDSPWYSTMRLFRQPRTGDWESVVTRVVQTLRELVLQ